MKTSFITTLLILISYITILNSSKIELNSNLEFECASENNDDHGFDF